MVIHAHDVELQKQWFRAKLAAEKSKNDVMKKVKGESQDDFVLLDARDRAAWERGHLPGALPMPLAEVDQLAATLDREREHVLYCWNAT